MRKVFVFFLATVICTSASAQFVARMQLKESVKGVCNEKNVIVAFPGFSDQEEAVSPASEKEIVEKLNSGVTFLHDKPDFEDKGMINLIINCKGELVQSKMDLKTKDPALDAQIEAVFKSLIEWKPAKLKGKKVDSARLYSFKIVKGKFTFD